jgi:hypothetical protein
MNDSRYIVPHANAQTVSLFLAITPFSLGLFGVREFGDGKGPQLTATDKKDFLALGSRAGRLEGVRLAVGRNKLRQRE